MILGSHNSWTFLKPKKWWMKVIAFTAKCQEYDIKNQYMAYSVRCFDLRVKFNDKGDVIIAHGVIEYGIDERALMEQLKWLNEKGDVYVRILHEVRKRNEYTKSNIDKFSELCFFLEKTFPNIKFWCGRNLYNWGVDYQFENEPTCEEKYSSVCPPKYDDLCPKCFAKKNNGKILKEGADKDILLIDYVNIVS